jgi:hypothetical protein
MLGIGQQLLFEFDLQVRRSCNIQWRFNRSSWWWHSEAGWGHRVAGRQTTQSREIRRRDRRQRKMWARAQLCFLVVGKRRNAAATLFMPRVLLIQSPTRTKPLNLGKKQEKVRTRAHWSRKYIKWLDPHVTFKLPPLPYPVRALPPIPILHSSTRLPDGPPSPEPSSVPLSPLVEEGPSLPPLHLHTPAILLPVSTLTSKMASALEGA